MLLLRFVGQKADEEGVYMKLELVTCRATTGRVASKKAGRFFICPCAPASSACLLPEYHSWLLRCDPKRDKCKQPSFIAFPPGVAVKRGHVFAGCRGKSVACLEKSGRCNKCIGFESFLGMRWRRATLTCVCSTHQPKTLQICCGFNSCTRGHCSN